MVKIYIIEADQEAVDQLHQGLLNLLTRCYWEYEFAPDLICETALAAHTKGCSSKVICLLGPKLLEQGDSAIAEIKRLFPAAALIAKCSPLLESLATVQLFAAAGVQYVLPAFTTPHDFIEKIILAQRQLFPNQACQDPCH